MRRVGIGLNVETVDVDRRTERVRTALDDDGIAGLHVQALVGEDIVRRGVERKVERVDRVGDREAEERSGAGVARG
jgi:hypothetical protein